MQPILVHRPFHREGWVYDEKVDGYRMVAYKEGGALSRCVLVPEISTPHVHGLRPPSA